MQSSMGRTPGDRDGSVNGVSSDNNLEKTESEITVCIHRGANYQQDL